MAQGFFTIRDHEDMLAKAERELDRMEADLNTDTVFNFFVSAYHVMDYVKAIPVPKTATDLMYADPDFEMCQFICNKGKHLELKRDDKDARFAPGEPTRFGRHRLGTVRLGWTSPRFLVDGREVNVLQLGRGLIAKWKAFFIANGI